MTAPRTFLRRHFLRGACGVAVGLPLLESFGTRSAHAAEPTVRRFIGFLTNSGVDMTRFRPTGPMGAITPATLAGTALEPLSAHADRLLVPRGIHTTPPGYTTATPGDDHHKGTGHRLTCAPLDASTLYAQGTSVDQVMASALNPGGRPPLTLDVGERGDGVYAYASYLAPGQPVPGENNPWLAYQDLMGLSGLDDEQLARITARRESVLDLLEDEFTALQAAKLSAVDSQKLDMHLTAIRDLELDMLDGVVPCLLDAARTAELQAIDPVTVGYDANYKAMGRMQMDLVALAIACGSTAVATLQWNHSVGGPIFGWDGMQHEYSHHKLSHGNTADDNSGGQVAGFLDMVHAIDRWYAGELAYLVEKLAAYEEGDGTLLDNCAVAWLHELSNGLTHSYLDMPHVVVGSCGGYLAPGRHVQVSSGDPNGQSDAGHNKLFTTLMNGMGMHADGGGPVTNFGDPDHC
ncbi:MAG TPA: DUF1552 domain-containing protein, partial [Nannocystaceae bacterium]|nr:DUF1552 domain-containing protein [Nannocystaceae bacterium]